MIQVVVQVVEIMKDVLVTLDLFLVNVEQDHGVVEELLVLVM
jgi:hypothetical protein